MKCEDVKERFLDYWSESLSPSDKEEMEGHLAACFDCGDEARELGGLWSRLESLPDEDPGPGARARFDVMLEAYRAGLKQASPSLLERVDSWLAPLWPRRPAFQFAIALLCMAAGAWLGLRGRGAGAPPTEIATLSSEVRDLRTLVTVSLLQQDSPAERLRGVSFSYQLDEARPAVTQALVETLNHDSNVNVRLAAVDALTQFSNQAGVRQALVRSLPGQDSPLVQIALIDLLVQIREKSSVDVMRTLAVTPDLHPAVRERAQWGMTQIS